MSQTKRHVIDIQDLRGGMNGTDSPQAIGMTQCVLAWNVDWFDGLLARKRYGSRNVSLTGGPSGPGVSAVTVRFGPLDSDLRLLTFSNNGGSIEVDMYDGSAWTSIGVGDGFVDGRNVSAVSLNGVAYLAYASGVNRLHALDSGSTTIRRVGLTMPGAGPTVANTGVGAYAATLRFYKVSYTVVSGGVILRRSELSVAVSFTPSGAGTAARVTKPASIGEGETHWELWGSSNNQTYVLLATTIVGTTTFDDSTVPASYTGEAPPLVGANLPPPSAKWLVADGPRIVMGGAYETSAGAGTDPKQNRVWFTPVLGSSGVGDLERVPVTVDQSNYLDLGENGDAGPLTGAGGPLDGVVWVFQRDAITALQQTGDSTAPYTRRQLTDAVGSLNHFGICSTEDGEGNPALSFISRFGPYRLGRMGLESLTAPVEHLFSAETPNLTIFGGYHRNRRQVWWVNLAPATGAQHILVYDVKHNAYSQYTLPTLFTPAAIAMYFDPFSVSRPFLFGDNTSGGAVLRRYDSFKTQPVPAAINATDAGFTYRAYVRTRAYAPAGFGTNFRTKEPIVLGHGETDPTTSIPVTTPIQVSVIRDFGKETVSGAGDVTVASGVSRIVTRVENCELSANGIVQFEIGDPNEQSVLWTLDAITIPWEAQEDRS